MHIILEDHAAFIFRVDQLVHVYLTAWCYFPEDHNLSFLQLFLSPRWFSLSEANYLLFLSQYFYYSFVIMSTPATLSVCNETDFCTLFESFWDSQCYM
jgi:hypothetical protein